MRVRIQSEPIDQAALLAGFARGTDAGAVASFAGRVRGDDQVDALELEAWPEFTEAAVGAEAARVTEAFDLLDLIIVHRIGRMTPGDTVVLVAAAARHRREAFRAVDRMMDWLKTAAPLWKREHGAAGARWIEPAARDHADAARWEG